MVMNGLVIIVVKSRHLKNLEKKFIFGKIAIGKITACNFDKKLKLLLLM